MARVDGRRAGRRRRGFRLRIGDHDPVGPDRPHPHRLRREGGHVRSSRPGDVHTPRGGPLGECCLHARGPVRFGTRREMPVDDGHHRTHVGGAMAVARPRAGRAEPA